MEGATRVSFAQSPIAEETSCSQPKTRRKRKWDQPADFFESTLGTSSVNMSASNGSSILTVHAPVTQKPCQIHDEIIAREIVINDAEASIRYILTKRQTQEEIHTFTGAVVITRGKYRLPNSPPNGEKPLYLHISSGGHLKEIADRIIAVDRATSIVEEILKHGQNSHFLSTSHTILHNGENVSQPLSICVFLGFDADPSLNICTRIRGPSDQYINHIMNETGATVLLRGRGSGNPENAAIDVTAQPPLHLFLSSYNPKNLEDARLLAENLLHTISAECGTSRISSSNPCKTFLSSQHLLGGVKESGFDRNTTIIQSRGLLSSNAGLVPSITSVPVVIPQVPPPRIGGLFRGLTQQSPTSCPQQSVITGTSYSGYGGIYPHATPLQQVALALRNSNSHTNSAHAPDKVKDNSAQKTSLKPPTKKEKLPQPRRKFQELPIPLKSDAELDQVFSLTFSEVNRVALDLSRPFICMLYRVFGRCPAPIPFLGVTLSNPPCSSRWGFTSVFHLQMKNNDPTTTHGSENVSAVPDLRNPVPPNSLGSMPPPPPHRNMPPPPPPIKSLSTTKLAEARGSRRDSWGRESENITGLSDTLIKLTEYGDDDDDDMDNGGDQHMKGCQGFVGSKPFWAV